MEQDAQFAAMPRCPPPPGTNKMHPLFVVAGVLRRPYAGVGGPAKEFWFGVRCWATCARMICAALGHATTLERGLRA
eukprot:809505-Pyramimonas_sp.AAC.1